MDDGAVSLDEISVPATDSKLSIHESFNEINGQMGGLLKKYEFEEYCGYEIILMKLSLEQLQQRVQREMITMKIDDTISKSVDNGCKNNQINELNDGQSSKLH
jgi:DNA-binding FrmR family transcriptional regulator